jgi:hypothetical protein
MGIATIRDIKKELKYQILIFLKNIYIMPLTHLTGKFIKSNYGHLRKKLINFLPFISVDFFTN